MKKSTFKNIGLVLILLGVIVAFYQEPIRENIIMWETSTGRYIDYPADGTKRIVIPTIVGSYSPYLLPGGMFILIGVVIVISEKSTQLEP